MKKMFHNLFLLALSLVILSLLPACKKKGSDGPAYNFQWTTRHYYIGNKIQFSSDAPANAVYLWDFGDGSKSTDANPWYKYGSSGTYLVKLTVNGKAQSPKSITIKKIDISTLPYPCIANTALNFTTVSPTDTTLYWDFGDSSSAIGTTVTHTYAHARNYHLVCMLANDSETLVHTEVLINKYPAQTHALAGTHVWHHNTYLEWMGGYYDSYTYYADTTFAIGYVDDFTAVIGASHFKYMSGNDSMYYYWNNVQDLNYNILTGKISVTQLFPYTGVGHALIGTVDEFYAP